MTQVDPIQLQLNQLRDDCEGAIKCAESFEEMVEIIKMYERQANQLLTQ
jgi:hypothetical protein